MVGGESTRSVLVALAVSGMFQMEEHPVFPDLVVEMPVPAGYFGPLYLIERFTHFSYPPVLIVRYQTRSNAM